MKLPTREKMDNKEDIAKKRRDPHEFFRTRCAVCWKKLGLKQHLLHGAASRKKDIKSKLKMILCPGDFSALYDKETLWKPRLCKPCFLLILKIPENILKLQKLVGKEINTQFSCTKDSRKDQMGKSEVENRRLPAGVEDAETHTDIKQRGKHTKGAYGVENLKDNSPCLNQQNAGSSYNVHSNRRPEFKSLHCSAKTPKNERYCGKKVVISKNEGTLYHHHHEDSNRGNIVLEHELDQNIYQLSSSVSSNNILNSTSDKNTNSENRITRSKSRLKTTSTENEKNVLIGVETSFSKSLNNPSILTGSSKNRKSSVKGRKCRDDGRSCIESFEMRRQSGSQANESNEKEKSIEDLSPSLVQKRNKLKTSNTKKRPYQCDEKDCGKEFLKRTDLFLHLRKHKEAKPPLENHLCCEQCGKRFGQKRYLDVHLRVHQKNDLHALNPPKRTVSCEREGCGKKFTSRVFMKRHVISVHQGRRPKPKAGVFFTCLVEGCGKEFSFKATLTRHNRLVHNREDYKLNRVTVRYPCRIDGCSEVFNRKKLLQSHQRHLHGVKGAVRKRKKIPSCENGDWKEALCSECGMAMLASQLQRHRKEYHGSQNEKISPFPCCFKDCDNQFTSEQERSAHILLHKDKPTYQCDVENCSKMFYLSKTFDNHLWNHCKKPTVCDFSGCGVTCDDQLVLAKHSRLHYDGKMLCGWRNWYGKMLCNWRNCGMFFTAMGSLKQHIIAHSRSLSAKFGADFVCAHCDRVFSTKHGLSKHTVLHDAQGQTVAEQESFFQCEEVGCSEKFSLERDYNNHLLDHFTCHQAVCSVQACGQVFDSQLNLVKHGKLHHHDNKYRCPWDQCKNEFLNFHFLKRHLLSHFLSQDHTSMERPFKCTKCDMRYRRHLLSHFLSQDHTSMERPFKCTKCDMSYRVESNLFSHAKTHTEKSKSICPECGKEFHPNHLKRHMLIHREEKAHPCTHCGVRYATTNGLRFHELQIHNIGKWPCECEFCGKGFISRTELRRHLPSHTKEKNFSCPVCDVKFATGSGLKGHMRKHTGESFPCDVTGCDKVFTSPLSLKGHRLQHEGFSKTCEQCGKIVNNPYTHKCRVGREAKKKKQTLDTGGPCSLPFSTALSSMSRVNPKVVATVPMTEHSTLGLTNQKSACSQGTNQQPVHTSVTNQQQGIYFVEANQQAPLTSLTNQHSLHTSVANQHPASFTRANQESVYVTGTNQQVANISLTNQHSTINTDTNPHHLVQSPQVSEHLSHTFQTQHHSQLSNTKDLTLTSTKQDQSRVHYTQLQPMHHQPHFSNQDVHTQHHYSSTTINHQQPISHQNIYVTAQHHFSPIDSHQQNSANSSKFSSHSELPHTTFSTLMPVTYLSSHPVYTQPPLPPPPPFPHPNTTQHQNPHS